jgi:hypothetical protein
MEVVLCMLYDLAEALHLLVDTRQNVFHLVFDSLL